MTTFNKTPTAKQGAHKQRMLSFTIDEISIVDKPAQEGATAPLSKRAIMKRETPEEKKLREEKEEQEKEAKKRDSRSVEKAVVLTSETDGHQHAIRLDRYDVENGGGSTMYMGGGADGESEHSHAFTIDANGAITIAANHGHTHEVDLLGFVQRLQLLGAVEKSILKEFGPSDYAYVPDPNDPNSWQFRLTKSPGGPPNRRLVGSVAASLGKAGALRSIPFSKRTTVLKRVRQAWLSANPNKSLSDLPPALKRFSATPITRGNSCKQN